MADQFPYKDIHDVAEEVAAQALASFFATDDVVERAVAKGVAAAFLVFANQIEKKADP